MKASPEKHSLINASESRLGNYKKEKIYKFIIFHTSVTKRLAFKLLSN